MSVIALLAVSLLAMPALAQVQPCPYETLVGLPATFVGDGVPASQARMYRASFTLTTNDGTIYFSDTGNHRVRRITPAGIVETVAGTGEPAFGGDGGPARQAQLNEPTALALGPNGTLYIADSQNHRVRAVRPDGTIHTVAGDGAFDFAGDGGPAIRASLNTPSSLALNSQGDLFVLDSVNCRVRRVGTDGFITTVIGSEGKNPYLAGECGSRSADQPGPAAEVAIYAPRSIAVGADDRLYLSQRAGIRRVEDDGTLSHVSLYQDSAPVQEPLEEPILVSERYLNHPIFVPGSGPELVFHAYVNNRLQLLALDTNGLMLRPLGMVTGNGISSSSHGQSVVAADFGNALYRLRFGEEPETIIPKSDGEDPGETGDPKSGTLDGISCVTSGPDGVIYMGALGKVYALKPDGKLSVIAGGGGLPFSGAAPGTSVRLSAVKDIALDSKGNLFLAYTRQIPILKLSPDGMLEPHLAPGTLYTDPPYGVAIDGQDRLYVFCGNRRHSRIYSINDDGSAADLTGRIGGEFYFGPIGRADDYGGLAVSPDGQVFSASYASFANAPSTILTVSEGSGPKLAPMEARHLATALAYAPGGRLYFASNGVVWALEPDGVTSPVFGADGRGFWGEAGFDSPPQNRASKIDDLAVDSSGRILVALGRRGALVRFDPSACGTGSGPQITGVLESATFNRNLRLAAGQLVSIFGLRLGPVDGMAGAPDGYGYFPKELASTRVLFNGVPGPVVFARADQVNAIVPFRFRGKGTVRVSVEHKGARSPAVSRNVAPYAPAAFSIFDSGASSLFARCLNQDGTINSEEAPAKLGSVIQLFVTGLGATTPAGADGKVATEIKRPRHPVTVFINNREAEILYAGVAPGLVEGVMQINVRLPEELPGSGGNAAWLAIQMGAGHVPQPNRMLFYVTK